jgi:hypothetical protein
LQCCLVTDGGGALILVAAAPEDFPLKPVYLLGTGESVETPMVSHHPSFLRKAGIQGLGIPTVALDPRFPRG